MKAMGVDGISEKVKVAILLYRVVEDGPEVFNIFDFEDWEAKNKLEDVLNKFARQCNPRKNALVLRYKFWECSQHEEKTIDQFVMDLKKMINK